MSVNAIGIEARGKCSALIRPRLPEIARTPLSTEDWVKVKMKTPVTRNGDEVVDAPAGADQQAEDQVVDRRVEQRGHDLPELAEPGLACTAPRYVALANSLMKCRRPHSCRV